MKYLGHVVGSMELHIDMDKFATARDWARKLISKVYSSYWVSPTSIIGLYLTFQVLLHLVLHISI